MGVRPRPGFALELGFDPYQIDHTIDIRRASMSHSAAAARRGGGASSPGQIGKLLTTSASLIGFFECPFG